MIERFIHKGDIIGPNNVYETYSECYANRPYLAHLDHSTNNNMLFLPTIHLHDCKRSLWKSEIIVSIIVLEKIMSRIRSTQVLFLGFLNHVSSLNGELKLYDQFPGNIFQ